MRVMGTLALMPGVGFILSAGVTWVLAKRLGLMPETQPTARPSTRGTSSEPKDRRGDEEDVCPGNPYFRVLTGRRCSRRRRPAARPAHG